MLCATGKYYARGGFAARGIMRELCAATPIALLIMREVMREVMRGRAGPTVGQMARLAVLEVLDAWGPQWARWRDWRS